MNFRLKLIISSCKYIPKTIKGELKKRLIRKHPLKGLNKRKDLFYQGMFARLYDLYTSSILALIYRNTISLSCLLRAQMENIMLIDYFLKDVDRFKIAFTRGKFIDSLNEFRKNNPSLCKYYDNLTQRSHPFQEGLKSAFSDMEVLAPKDINNNEISEEDFSNIEEFLKKVKRKATVGYNAIPYDSIKKEDVPIAANNVIMFYDIALAKLEKLHGILPETKVEDYKELWKRHNKK